MRPRPGDLLRIDGRASVQFGGDRALTFRVVSVGPELAYLGWTWLTGYVLDRHGLATAKREVFVQLAGLRPTLDPTPAQRPGHGRVQSNRAQASISVGASGRAGR
ncbi:hypothetical protein [Micromonospora sp. NBS 11-29]|uniref:hypothetical protein n=1 Tax=Micromonospora sp. NBS 11-29 TaxID=1960879 RepID=UPI000B7796A0|nr:hypothetical protein [Micromonospora sp. NBS 11-29]